MRSEYVEMELSPFIDFFQSSQISLNKVDVDVGGRAAHMVLELIYHTSKTTSKQ